MLINLVTKKCMLRIYQRKVAWYLRGHWSENILSKWEQFTFTLYRYHMVLSLPLRQSSGAIIWLIKAFLTIQNYQNEPIFMKCSIFFKYWEYNAFYKKIELIVINRETYYTTKLSYSNTFFRYDDRF